MDLMTLRLAFGMVLACAGAVAQQDFSKVQIKVTKVAGSVYMLEGSGGNIGVSAGEDGIVIVDDQFAPLAVKIREALKGISNKPIRFVINTHFHGDHTGGNPQFGETSTIIAQENVRKRLMAPPANAAYQGAAKVGLPVITFESDLAVHVNGEDIRAIHFPNGHTDGDAVIYFPQSNVVHMGDDFVRYGFPFIDLKNGGSVRGMIDGVEKAIAKLPADVKVIPGHGAIATLDDVRDYVKMLRETSKVVADGILSGKTADQMKKERVLGKWDSFSGSSAKTDGWIDTLYNSLTEKKDGAFLRHN